MGREGALKEKRGGAEGEMEGSEGAERYGQASRGPVGGAVDGLAGVSFHRGGEGERPYWSDFLFAPFSNWWAGLYRCCQGG